MSVAALNAVVRTGAGAIASSVVFVASASFVFCTATSFSVVAAVGFASSAWVCAFSGLVATASVFAVLVLSVSATVSDVLSSPAAGSVFVKVTSLSLTVSVLSSTTSDTVFSATASSAETLPA